METRKNLPRSVLARIYFIDRQIASGRYPNVNYLAREYEVGTATIYRDIEYMRDMLHAPIAYSAKHRGWYYEEKSFRLPARFTSASDMLALGMAKSLLTLYKNTPLYESAQRLLDNITAPLSPDESDEVKQAAWYEKRIIVPQVASARVNTEIWDLIVEAMKENRVVTFDYKGVWDKKYNPRLVRPYQLLFDTGVWYLYGHSEERNSIRIFSLSRMMNVAITNEKFSLPKDFDYCVKNGGSYFGVFSGWKRRYKITFDSNLVQDVQDRIWAADQKIMPQDNDLGIVISFSSTQFQKVLSWVLSFGYGAQPLEPLELVTEWKKHIISLYAKIKDRSPLPIP
jgi:predicted DNA-binding transcriptional regulator YafY